MSCPIFFSLLLSLLPSINITQIDYTVVVHGISLFSYDVEEEEEEEEKEGESPRHTRRFLFSPPNPYPNPNRILPSCPGGKREQ